MCEFFSTLKGTKIKTRGSSFVTLFNSVKKYLSLYNKFFNIISTILCPMSNLLMLKWEIIFKDRTMPEICIHCLAFIDKTIYMNLIIFLCRVYTEQQLTAFRDVKLKANNDKDRMLTYVSA